jgi:dimethylsulfoniopropionate demethylase
MRLYDEKNNDVGLLRAAVFSPTFKKVIGIAMINKKYWKESQEFKISINGKSATGKICSLPLV